MFNQKQLAADLLCMRTKQKVEGEENLKKLNIPKLKEALESECLYYWLLSRLYVQMESYIPARNMVTITITGEMTNYNKVLLEHGKMDDYIPYYVEGKEFFDVVKQTLEIFDELDKFDYNYFQNTEDSCEFWICMSANRKS